MTFDERSDFATEFARDSRGEDRLARRYARGECAPGRHRLTRSGNGGVCVGCGMTVGGEEL